MRSSGADPSICLDPAEGPWEISSVRPHTAFEITAAFGGLGTTGRRYEDTTAPSALNTKERNEYQDHGKSFNTEARSHEDERWSGVGSRPERAGWGGRVNRVNTGHTCILTWLAFARFTLPPPRAMRAADTQASRVTRRNPACSLRASP